MCVLRTLELFYTVPVYVCLTYKVDCVYWCIPTDNHRRKETAYQGMFCVGKTLRMNALLLHMQERDQLLHAHTGKGGTINQFCF